MTVLRSLRWKPSVLCIVALLIPLEARTAYPKPTCRGIFIWSCQQDGTCAGGLKTFWVPKVAIDCETGGPPDVNECSTLTPDEIVAYSGFPYYAWLSWPSCVADVPCSTYIANTCEKQKKPTACVNASAGSNPLFSSMQNATSDAANTVGDPVDLTTGALGLGPTDIDLGGGLIKQLLFCKSG